MAVQEGEALSAKGENMHELKKLLDEIKTMPKDDNNTYIPNQIFDFNLTTEELVLYTVYCRYKSEGASLPGIDKLARVTSLKPALVKITMAALAAKGITYD